MNNSSAKDVMLPQGWRKIRLGEVSKFSKGSGITKAEVIAEGVPCVRYGELYTKHNFRINDFYSFISDKNSGKHKLIKNNDLLFAGSGETREEIGKCASFHHTIKAYAGGDVIICSIDPKILRADFASYYLNTVGRRQINKLGQGDSIVHIYSRYLENVEIPVPPLPEQKAIASIFETWDTAIEKMEDIIIAKQKRFEWLSAWMMNKIEHRKNIKKIQLGTILKYEQPTKYLVKSAEYTNDGETPVLTANKSFILGYTEEREGIYDKLPVIIFDDFTTESKFVDFPFKVKSSAMKILMSTSNNIDLGYVFIAMQRIKIPMGGHKRYWISEFQFFDIPLPRLKEQQGIALTLNIARQEIDTLKQLTDKYHTQKRGLMQKLLTGEWRIR